MLGAQPGQAGDVLAQARQRRTHREREIVLGRAVARAAVECPAVQLDDGRADGACSPDGQVMGTYLHGLFESSEACVAILRWAGLDAVQAVDYQALRERDIERLADQVEAHLDTQRLRLLCGLPL
ncbi:Cobyric acid synthase [compost metagenome]